MVTMMDTHMNGLISDCESSESSVEESRCVFDDAASRESSLLDDEYDDFFGDDDEETVSSFISHDIPLATSCAASVCSVESALPRSDSMASVESALTSFSNDGLGGPSSAESSGDYYSSDDEEEDYMVAVNMTPVANKRSLKGHKKYGSQNSLDGGSCHSIKEHLAIDSISEDATAANAPTIEYKFEYNGDFMVEEVNNLLSRIVHSTQNMAVDSNLNITEKATLTRTANTKAFSHKTDDPLLRKYLNNRRKKTKSKPKPNNGSTICSILGSTDSLLHIKGTKNKRVVKTREHVVKSPEAKHLVLESKDDSDEFACDFDVPIKADDLEEEDRKPAARRTKARRETSSSRKNKKNSSEDPLLQRYMDMGKAPAAAKAPSGVLNSLDSMARVTGKGNRIVKTRTRGLAEVF